MTHNLSNETAGMLTDMMTAFVTSSTLFISLFRVDCFLLVYAVILFMKFSKKQRFMMNAVY